MTAQARAVPRPILGAALMIASCALIAATTLMAKALGRGVDGSALHPLQVSAGRFCFAFLALLPIVAWLRPGFRGARWAIHLGRSLCGWAGISCLFAAAALMPLADATALSFLSPLITMLLAIPLLGERVGPWRWGAAGIALCGALILIRPGSDVFQAAALIALAAAVFLGLEAILIKRLSDGEPPIRILTINNAIGATVSLAAASLVWVAPTSQQWAVLALLGITMLSAQTFFIQSMKQGDASSVMPFFYATLVFAAVYDFVVFGDLPTFAGVIGAGLIVGGALLLAWREHRQRVRSDQAGIT